ncbi:MAG: hypothetical protein KF768_13395 [Phycisphaeraceae bacterium]|nr:hypothetical protein [Phycisphaeraceae bacterium]
MSHEQHITSTPARPPPVPPAPRPLRVAIIGWARLSAQAWEGSGYNLNASEFARGLAMRGHHVRYLQSGMAFSWGLTGPAAPRIRLRERWGPGKVRSAQDHSTADRGGIPCFELVNSPNLSPAAWNFGNLAHEIADPATSGLVVDWLKGTSDELPADAHQPVDIVHIHSQEGLGLDLIPTIRSAGFPVVVTLHNYWFLCPQVDLLHAERSVCTDYDGGRRCETCLTHHEVGKLRSAKAMGDSLESLLGLYAADVVRKSAYGTLSVIKGLLGRDAEDRAKRAQAKARIARPPHPDVHPDPELFSGWTSPVHPVEPSAHAPLEDWEQPKDYEHAHRDTNERVLAGAPTSSTPPAPGTPKARSASMRQHISSASIRSIPSAASMHSTSPLTTLGFNSGNAVALSGLL